jgi:hypothetical protein
MRASEERSKAIRLFDDFTIDGNTIKVSLEVR